MPVARLTLLCAAAVLLLASPARPQAPIDPATVPAKNPTPLDQVHVLQTPAEALQPLPGYPFKPHFVEVSPGIRMHYVDEGDAGRAVVLLLHGQPYWSYEWRKVVARLTQAGYRVVAPDLIGYGRSDKPSSVYDFSYQRHVDWLTSFVRKIDLRQTTLVVHDWGGLLGFRVLTSDADGGRFKRLVVLNTSLPVGDFHEYVKQRAAGFDQKLEAFRRYLLTTPDLKIAPGATTLSNPLSPEEAAAYDSPYPDDRHKSGPRVMTSLIPLSPGDPGARENQAVKEALSRFGKPVLIVWGEADRSHPGQHEIVSSLFPKSAVWKDVGFADARHLVQEDKPDQVAGLIDEFIRTAPNQAGGPPAVAAIPEADAPAPATGPSPASGSSSLPRKTDLYDFAALTRTLQGSIDDNTAKGFSLMVVKDGAVVYEKAFGTFTLDTVVPIASSTKMPTTLAVLTLVDQKKISLDDKVGKYLAGWPADKADVTLRQCLSCTHGLPVVGLAARRNYPTIEAEVKEIARSRVKAKAGEEFSYSNTGFQVAGRVAEVISGKPWAEFFQDAVARPLGLKTFTYGETKDPLLAGGAASNLEDYAKLLVVHLNDGMFGSTRIIGPEALAEMRKDHVGDRKIAYSPFRDDRHYGLSLWISPPEQGKPAIEFSDPGAFGCTPWLDTSRGYGAVLLIRDRMTTGMKIWNAIRPVMNAEIDRGGHSAGK